MYKATLYTLFVHHEQ